MSVKITYRGWAGHFICCDRCLFRLNTLIECGRSKVVVSTVGAMVDIHKTDANGKCVFDAIGHDRHYETMAFYAKYDGEFWDADVSRQINFGSPWRWPKLADELKAQAGHEKVVAEIVGKMERGEKL